MDTLNREELIRYLRQLSLKYSWKEQFEYSTSAPAELNFDGDCGSFVGQEDYIEENNNIIKHSRSDVKLRRIIINTDSASDEDIQRMRAVTSEVIDSSSGALCSKYQANTQIDGNDEINEYLTNNSFDTEKLVEEPCSSPESIIKIQPKSGRKSRRIICDSEDEEEQSSGHKQLTNTQLLLTADLCSPLVPAKKVVKPVLVEARPARRARRVILSDSEEEGEIVQESEGSFLASRTRQGGGVAADSEDEALVDSDCSSTESWIVEDDDEEGSVDSNSSRSDWKDAEEGDVSGDYSSSSSCHDQDSDLEEADRENHSSNNSPIHQTAAGKSTSNSSSSRGGKSIATPHKGLHSRRSTSSIVPKTPSRTERNQQRVEALSTGLKSRRGRAYHHALAQDLFQIYNEVIFDSRLPADLAVTWNKRLLTTAGYCRCKKLAGTDGSGSRRRLAAIELSNKVSSTPMCSA